MPRPAKKFLYGVFYLFILALILWPIVKSFQTTTASCFDNVQNQNETGVDCGGSCASCAIKNLEAVRLLTPVKFFSLSSGETVLLAEVLNPNADYDAVNTSYIFKIYNADSQLLQRVSGAIIIYGGERRYIFSADVSLAAQTIARVDIEFLKPDWRSVGESLRPNFAPTSKIKTEISEKNIKVSGSLNNQSSLAVQEVELIAILHDRLNQPIFASKTILTDINGLEERTFVISFPSDSSLASRLNSNATEVFANVK